MNKSAYTAKKDLKNLRVLTISALVLTFVSISHKFIGGYNLAVREDQFHLMTSANNSGSFDILDCYEFINHPALFTFFSLFLFLFSIAAKKTKKIRYLSMLSFCLFTLSLLQATYLDSWFVQITDTKWNSVLFMPDVFDGILYFCFAFTLILQLKIICRFTKERFQAKISLI